MISIIAKVFVYFAAAELQLFGEADLQLFREADSDEADMLNEVLRLEGQLEQLSGAYLYNCLIIYHKQILIQKKKD